MSAIEACLGQMYLSSRAMSHTISRMQSRNPADLQPGCYVMQVLMVRDGLAIVEGLKNDAPIGTELSFVSGASG